MRRLACLPGSPYPPAESIILRALWRIAGSGAPADKLLRASLRANPQLDNAARRRVGLGVHGVRCFERRLCYLLMQVGLPTSARLRFALYALEQLGEALPSVAAALALSRKEQARLQGALGFEAWPEDPAQRLAVQYSLPDWIAARWISELGETSAASLAAALNAPGPITIRVNPAHGSREDLQSKLRSLGVESEPCARAPLGLHLAGRPDIRGNPLYQAGAFEVQDEGSQLIVEAVAARPGQRGLDLCAGAGGKSLALLAAMEGQGALFATDVDPARLADLCARRRRVDSAALSVLQLPPDGALPAAVPGGLDFVLVDAPCSALGTWRRGPDRRWRVQPQEVARLSALQRRLLSVGASKLRPGGRLVYASCTLLREENEAVAAAAPPELSPVAALPQSAQATVQLRPDVHGTDGFFIAAFERR